MSCCSDSESDSHVFVASPALGACELCKAPIPKGQKADQGLYALRCLDKACYNALQALRRVAKRSPGMDVADTLVEDPDRLRSMALVLRTDKGTRRERQNLDDVKEYLQSMAATRTQSRSRRQMLLTKRQWVCWQKQTNGYGGAKRSSFGRRPSSIRQCTRIRPRPGRSSSPPTSHWSCRTRRRWNGGGRSSRGWPWATPRRRPSFAVVCKRRRRASRKPTSCGSGAR